MVTKVILNQEQTQLVSDTNQQQEQAIVNAAQASAISGNQFVFFAAFDGTNNTLDNLPKANEKTTNVAQLWTQYAQYLGGNLGGNYYAGPGTPGTLTGSSWLPSQVTQQVINKAQEAYTDFSKQASLWLQEHQGGSVTVALTSFSRGGASAAIFSQMLYEKGLVDPDGKVLIAPGQVEVSAGVIFDPVTTGVDGNLAFAPNVSNIVNIVARNEYRYMFKASDYRNQSNMSTIEMLGNHCDIGGGYDNGTGALSLQAATEFFQRAGLTMGDVPADRQFDPAQVFIHDESVDDFGNRQWDVYDGISGFPTGERLLGSEKFTPADTKTVNGETIQELTLYNGNTIKLTRLDSGSEQVELDFESSDETQTRVIQDYIGIDDETAPDVMVDEIVIQEDSSNGVQTINATFYDDSGMVIVDVDTADGEKSSTLSIKGIEEFTILVTPDDEQDLIDISRMDDGVHIDLTGSGDDASGEDTSDFSIRISEVVGVENREADGGEVWLDGERVSFATRMDDEEGEAIYQDKEGNTFVLSDSELQIDGIFTIVDFDNGKLGLYLDEEENDDPEDKPDYDTQKSKRWIDPLALDLNGNGKIDTVASMQSKAYFDFNGDGIGERAGWIASGDGLLVLDANANGAVDNLSELFGTDLLSGFDDLRQRMDGNGDGVIDSQDVNFANLRVWIDANGDGVAQSGELKTLESLGISSIGTDATSTNIQDAGNVVTAISSFEQNGNEALAGDVEFAVDFSLTNADPSRPMDQNPTIDADVFQLPWLRGYGVVKSLHLAYQSDPQLKQEARDLIAQGRQAILSSFDSFFAKWTGLEAVHQAKGVTRTNLSIEDKVWMLETLMGQDTSKSAIEAAAFGPIVMTNSGRRLGWDEDYINSKYTILESRAALGFAIQATAKDWLKGAYYSLALDKFVVIDASRFLASLQTALNAITNVDDANFAALVLGRLKADEVDLATASMKQALAGSAYAQIFYTALDFEGEHVIQMTTPGVFIAPDNKGWFAVASVDHDTVIGGAGNDVLNGGSGNDCLQGGSGNDIYLYKRGDGSDTIFDDDRTPGNVDTIRIGDGIAANDIRFSRDGDNLVLGINGTNDNLTIRNSEAATSYRIEKIEFADGTVIAIPLLGTSGDDVVRGDAEVNVLEGGRGNDTLVGGGGNDTYLFNPGDGQDTIYDFDSAPGNVDTIRFGDGIVASKLRLIRQRDDLVLSVDGTSDSVTIQDWGKDDWFGTDGHRIEQLVFADGTVWDRAYLQEKVAALSIVGTNDNDVLYGTSGNDTLIGGLGNDTLVGSGGNDTYLFNLGDGQDGILEADIFGNYVDTIRFGEDITPDKIRIARDGNYVALRIEGTNDQLKYFNYYSSRPEKFVFADGTIWDIAYVQEQVANIPVVGTDADDALNGDEVNNILEGGSGNDILFGYEGSDTYIFNLGDGKDSIKEEYIPGSTDSIRIRYGNGISADKIRFVRNGQDLVLHIDGTDDQVSIRNWFSVKSTYGQSFTVEEISFADGTTWDNVFFQTQVSGIPIIGTSGNDNLIGDTYANTFGGGLGNDTLQGGSGNDIYLFGLGDGQDTIYDDDPKSGNVDTISFGAGIAASDVKLNKDGATLVFRINGTSDQLSVQNWAGSESYRIEQVVFADGTVWDKAYLQMLVAALPIVGTNGDDILKGKITGNNTFQGLNGNDTLQGGVYNDTYLFNLGDGQDEILDRGMPGTVDSIRFGSGIAADDIVFSTNGTGLVLGIKNTADRVMIQAWLEDKRNHIEQVVFADGTVWDKVYLETKAAAQFSKELLVQVHANGDDYSYMPMWQGDAYVIHGTGGKDSLNGTNGNDILNGGDGNDVLYGGSGSDVLIGGLGSDDLDDGRSGRSVLDGGDGDDSLNGGASLDLLLGGNGDDYLESYGNFSTVAGGSGSDDIESYGDYSSVAGGSDNDDIESYGDNSIITGGDGDDYIESYGEHSTIKGGSGNDYIETYGEYSIVFGGVGNDELIGENTNDTYIFNAGDGADIISDWDDELSAIDTIRFGEGILTDQVKVSREGNDLIFAIGNNGDSIKINGWIDPEARIERVEFADGSVWDTDHIIALADAPKNSAPVLTTPVSDMTAEKGKSFSASLPANVFTDADTVDKLTYSVSLVDGTAIPAWLTFDPVNWTFGGKPGNGDVGQIQLKLTATDSAGLVASTTFNITVNDVNYAPAVNAPLRDLVADEASDFSFKVPADTFVDSDLGESLLYSAALADGKALPSWLAFDPATMTFNGKPGDGDTGEIGIRITATDQGGLTASTTMTLTVNNINQSPMAAGSLASQTGNEAKSFIFTIPDGSFADPDAADTLSYQVSLADGSALPAWLTFDVASRTLRGTPAHADIGSLDIKVTAMDSGSLQASTVFTLTVAPTPDQVFAGTSGANMLAGGSGNDLLQGLGGNDRLAGNEGNDTLDGGTGADTLIGGTGNDSYIVNASNDVITEVAGEGIDTVNSSVTYTLAANLENLALTGISNINATGNVLDNVLIGNAGKNILNGDVGADTMSGGLGSDTYVVDNSGDVVDEAVNEGTDAIRAGIGYVLGDNVENLILTGVDSINGKGNVANNAMTGNSAANVLDGEAGNDTLDGGGGADTLVGGLGNDVYLVNDSSAIMVEVSGEGTDTAKSTVTYSLADNVENLTLLGTNAVDGTGNGLNNTIAGNTANNILNGNSGNDVLNGGGGTDTLIGGIGNDTYVVANSGVVIVEVDGEGTDTVKSSVTYALADNVENLALTGSDAINGAGNGLNNAIKGNGGGNMLNGGAGNDTLNGGGGADTLAGGAGNDIYVVDSNLIVVTENASEGIDTVKTAISYTLGDNVENLSLTGSVAVNGFGNGLNNVLTGNSNANLLDGYAGNDTIQGNAANDVLRGGEGNDTLKDSGGNNVLDGGAGTDILTGNAGNEMFIGGAGNDSITTGTGADIIAFNRGDGQDTVAASTGVDNTISLGGGIRYEDLALRKSANDLILETGGSDRITLKNWYSSTTNHSVQNLQVILDSTAYDPDSADPLMNKQVEVFDFAALVDQFDKARGATPTLSRWTMMNSLLGMHLSGSDSDALGGDLVYQYGTNSSLSGVALNAAQAVINQVQFGASAQTLHPVEGLQEGVVKLG